MDPNFIAVFSFNKNQVLNSLAQEGLIERSLKILGEDKNKSNEANITFNEE
jgi:hypothetical protein